ncbi:MAG: response regulator [Myxococcales bacterium]|nr:response regulator [Myxococcales bacterium]MCB9731826.1 response regulator [Deltaproteobacteria bacterium]
MQASATWLLVDDDEIDLELVRRTMRREQIELDTAEARGGEQALDWLRREGRTRGSVVVLLDLRMPRMTGHEFLAAVRADPALRRTRVFVLSTSHDRRDIALAYDQGAVGYFVKGDNASLRDQLRCIAEYTRLASLPVPSDAALKGI